ncbi:hypothetical protein MRX96_009642 [Rhipicephalus microplus]
MMTQNPPSNDDGSVWVLVPKKRRTQADLPVSQPSKELKQVNFKAAPINVGQRDRSHYPRLFTTTMPSYAHWEAYAWTNGLAPHIRGLLELPQVYLLPKSTSRFSVCVLDKTSVF